MNKWQNFWRLWNMRLENERFLIVKKTKRFLMELERIISSFPNRDHVAKNRIVEDGFVLLENIYMMNSMKEDSDLRIYQLQILTKINMLDFYLERAFKLRYISEERCLSLCNSLTEINKMVVAWMLNRDHGKI